MADFYLKNYEINCSGLTKNSYNPKTKEMILNKPSYPNMELVSIANSMGINFTIGSDAHSPDKVGANITSIIGKCSTRGIKSFGYYVNGARKTFEF